MKNGETLKVVHVRINDLKPAAYNPRRHDPQASEHLAESIRRFGMIDPVIANAAPKRKNIVIGGHFRLKVAKSLGHETIPVVYVNIPDTEQEKELNLRLNRNTGSWDYDLLREFDVELLLDVGFDDADMADMWDDVLDTEDDDHDEKQAARIKKPTCKLGELYQLGEHRLVIGDATDLKVVKRVMGGMKADMAFSDPPYNIGFDYAGGISGNGKYGGTTEDTRTDAEYRAFIGKAMKNALAVSKKDAHHFWWCDQRYVGMFQSLYTELGVAYKRTCLWIKNNQNPTPQVAFNKAYEPCVYGTVGSPYLHEAATNLNELLNKEVGTGNRLPDDVMDLFDIWLADRLASSEYEHPTAKPPTLHEKALRRCTKVGDVVLDSFGGSGSTLIACEQMKRKCRLIELDPVFAQVILNRYEAFTGDKPERID